MVKKSFAKYVIRNPLFSYLAQFVKVNDALLDL